MKESILSHDRLRVWNKHHQDYPKDAIYIGRGSPWGNPWTHLTKTTNATLVVASRDEACDRFEEFVEAHPSLKETIKKELRGKHLLCFCKPHRCHGDYLLKIANE